MKNCMKDRKFNEFYAVMSFKSTTFETAKKWLIKNRRKEQPA